MAPICAKAAFFCAFSSIALAFALLNATKRHTPKKANRKDAGRSTLLRRSLSVGLALALLASGAAGSTLALGYAAYVKVSGERLLSDAPKRAEVTLLEDCAETTFLPRALCRVRIDGRASANVIVDFDEGASYKCGERLAIEGKLARPSDSSADYCWKKGSVLVFRAYTVKPVEQVNAKGWLLAFRERAIEAIGAEDDAHVLLQALSCGYRANLSATQLYSAFQRTGLAHMVSVSGAHLVIVTSLISALLKVLKAPRRFSIPLLVSLMAAYTVMAGMPISCIRAALMSSVGILSLLGKRRPSSLNALGLVIFAVVCNTPHAAIASSFALSALATLGIVIFSPLFEMLAARIPYNVPEGVVQAFALSISASFLAQWYASALFKTVPLISPLANVVCAPLLPVCCSCGLIASASNAFNLPFATYLMQVSSLTADALIAAVTFFAKIPYASIPASIQPTSALIAASVCAAFVWVIWERLVDKPFLLTCTAFAIALATSLWFTPAADAIIMLDVGQGDSFLLTSGGKNMLIDTGNQDRRLLDQLARCRVAHLDCVVITHADDDHCGSLDALQKAVEVDTVFLAEGLLSCEDEKCRQLITQAQATGGEVVGLKVHDSFSIGKFGAEVLWPVKLADSGGNADSIVLKVGYDDACDGTDDVSALFLGDAEHEQLEEIIKDNDLKDIDILKVAHHGSRNAMDFGQAQRLKPKIALIGVGKDNRYGHPTKEILEMLESIDCMVLRSDDDGGVKLEAKGDRVIIRML